jgi:16S rRNA (guanine1207-N2)-methyltransferase
MPDFADDITRLVEDYARIHTFTTRLRGQPVVYLSKPGMPDWQLVSPSQQLLAEQSNLAPGSQALLFGSAQGAAAAVLARLLAPGELWISDPHCIAVEMTRRTLQVNGLQAAQISPLIELPQELHSYFDAALIDLPKSRGRLRRWLLLARQALKPGGMLFLAGAKTGGILSAQQDAEALFGRSQTLAFRKGSRIFACRSLPGERLEPAWASEPGIAPGSWHTFEAALAGRRMMFSSLPGVFSYERLDDGTAMLLATLPAQLGGHLLDLGCGCGPIGIAAGLIPGKQPASQVELIDCDLEALACARRNLQHAGLPLECAHPGDGIPPEKMAAYDWVLTNPPFHAGQRQAYEMALAFIAQAQRALVGGGGLLLVANRFLPYDKAMRQVFAEVVSVAQDNRYHLLLGKK